MIVTFNQIAYFKPATTARRLKAYYHSETMGPEVFLNYLRLINLVATLCPNVAQLSVDLYREEVRELFFLQKDNPAIIKHLWRFRRFFTAAECCALLQKAVLETGTAGGKNEKSVFQIVPGVQSALIFVDFYRIDGTKPGFSAYFPAKESLFFGQSS
ncbi:hypothetical protein P7H31_05530 [Enterococcus asini]|uniref:hypothetical protein n=1 Tax=Enterococcus asini TaxID=57732 RepID=UPI00138671C9|nr:hypothetical protein [Enterococcus asini]MDT2763766.1 hypothetical protein [Enterococcus asini]